jgi:putative ABC transport system permease protein
VEIVVLFAFAAGLLVLYTALSSAGEERSREAALLRAFGATGAQLARAQRTELIGMGAIAGMLASVAAVAVGWMLARQVLHMAYHGSWIVFFAGAAAGAAGSWAAGSVALSRVLRAAPMLSLRQT